MTLKHTMFFDYSVIILKQNKNNNNKTQSNVHTHTHTHVMLWVFLRSLGVKNLPANEGDTCIKHGFNPWFGKIVWRKQQPTPVVLPGKSHRQRSLVGYSPWGCKELTRLSNKTTTEQLSMYVLSIYIFIKLSERTKGK